MRSAIISNYTLIREGLNLIISKYGGMNIKLIAETMKEAITLINKSEIDLVFLDLHEHNKDELLLINKIKLYGTKTKFIILDFNGNKELFVHAIKCGVEGYILGLSNENEIYHIIDQVCRGKKYFDAYFIDSMINENEVEEDVICDLTAREREILRAIGAGMSNRKISEKFFISEHTVKKHINHIFNKLNIRDRTQVALYANRYGNNA